MATPVSGSSPYCSGAQFLERYDVRTVAQLLPDTDASMSLSQVAASPRLATLLKGSSGKVESVALMGGKYTPADLAALTGNMAEFLADLVADLAAPKVLGRRFMEFPDFTERFEEAKGFLKELLEGRAIFGEQEVMDAGRIDDHVETADEVEGRNMITFQADRYFSRRANRY